MTEDSEPNGSKHSLNLACSQSLCACNFDLRSVVPKYLNLTTSSKNQFIVFMLCFVLSSDNVTLTCTGKPG
jgi:hypothetical protein